MAHDDATMMTHHFESWMEPQSAHPDVPLSGRSPMAGSQMLLLLHDGHTPQSVRWRWHVQDAQGGGVLVMYVCVCVGGEGRGRQGRVRGGQGRFPSRSCCRRRQRVFKQRGSPLQGMCLFLCCW